MEKNQVLDKLQNREISKKEAYKLLYQEPKQVKTKKAHFIKVRIHVPEERGANLFLKIILVFPIPIFLVKWFIKRRQTLKISDQEVSVEELINLIQAKGVSVNVQSHDGTKIVVKTY